MVVNKQIKKSNVKVNKKSQGKEKEVQKKKVVEEVESDDDMSFDDMSEEELKKMLGNSDNSDVESDDFSEEENVESKEAKVNKKRKLESDDEEVGSIKKTKLDDINVGLDDEDDDEDDDDEEDDDDSFIDDSMEEEEEEEVKTSVVSKKSDIKPAEKEKNIKMEYNENFEFRKIYEDTPKVESESLRKEIRDRIVGRGQKTFILLNLPFKFTYTMAKELIPDMISVIIPYNVHRHQINGNAYVDVSSKELVQKYCAKLQGMKIKNNKISCLPFKKPDENIDNYNCTRLAISNLSIKATAESLKRILTKATTIKLMPMKKKDKRMTQIAFAEYPCVEDAIFDYDTKHGIEFEGLPINIKFQSKSNTNIKKSISWDKKALHVVGITKAMGEDDMKKIFPHSTNINWKVGDQIASINYQTVEDCSVDYQNSIKSRPSPKMKIFYKCLRHKNSNHQKPNLAEKKDFKEKQHFKDKKTKKDVKDKRASGNENQEPKRENKKFQSKPRFNSKKEFKRKDNVKPSHNKKFKNVPEDKIYFNISKLNDTEIKVKTVNEIKNDKSNNNKLKKKIINAEKVNTGNNAKNDIKGKEQIPLSTSQKNHESIIKKFKGEKNKKKKDKKIQSDLINKKKLEKRAQKLMKKKLRKETEKLAKK